MKSYRRSKPSDELDKLVRGRAPVQVNQKVHKFQDRRTKRRRDRAAKNRRAIEEASD
jgi:hypothetical protein